MKKIIFTAGGTGGHIFPALAVAKLCNEYNILWVGAKGGIENKIIPQHNIAIQSINISALRKKGLIRLFAMPFLLLRSFWQVFKIILKERPDVIIGFGGYATFPVCFVGNLLRIPVIIHEQNSIPGLTNKILAKFANKVIVAFPRVLSSKKTLLLGNPVRKDLLTISAPEERYSSRVGGLNILVLGGSLGAKIFNDCLPKVFNRVELIKSDHIANIKHQAGRGDCEEVLAKYHELGIKNVQVTSFIDDMALEYRNADLIICRAGASTVSEVCNVGIAAIFVPYPYAVDDHQRYNVQGLVDENAALMILQNELEINGLASVIKGLGRSKCLAMALKAKHMALIDSDQKIKQVITNFIV